MARSTFYNGLKSKADRWVVERKLIAQIFHQHQGRYGYRRITEEMRNQGHVINTKTVRRLMKDIGLTCMVRMKKYRSYKGEVGRIAPNLLDRDFNTPEPLTKIATDVTEFSLFGEKLYLSPVIDMYNGEILSYTLYERPVLEMALEMVRKLIKISGSHTNAIFHSDQGWHYQHKKYQTLLKENGFIQSMSRKGNCLDNSVMENFFGLLKSELLYLRKFESIKEFKSELHKYIYYYNNARIKLRLNGKSPVQYRLAQQTAIGNSSSMRISASL